mgnify:CR=1 FL=1
MDINKWLAKHPVSCTYGAPLGDKGERGDSSRPYKFHLQLLDMVDLCYDRAGTYWGMGDRHRGYMYGYMCDDPEDGLVFGFVRARSREEAKNKVRDCYLHARFYR